MRTPPHGRATGRASGALPPCAPPGRAPTVRARLRRALMRSAALLGAVLVLLVALPAPSASAAVPGIPDCKEAPTPEVPGRGTVGFFEGPPAALPAPANPFDAATQTSIHEQYGYAGLQWHTYDLGCGPEVARSPDATIGTALANWTYTLPKTLVAATGALLGAAYEPDFLGVFDTLTVRVVDALKATVFQQWAGLVVAAIGVLLLWRSRGMHLSSAAAAIGWAVLVMIMVTAVFRWPLVAGQAADQAVTATMTSVTTALNQQTEADGATSPGEEVAASLHQALLYQPWLGGQFGDNRGEIARTYGPRIYDAQALTWQQAKTLQEDPVGGQRIVQAKQEAFTAAAAEVQARDPDAYEYMVGHRSDARVGYAVLSTIAVLCAVPFLLMSAFLVLGALIIIRFGVMLFPAIATLGMFPTMRGLVVGLGNTIAAALINAIVFGIGTAVTVKGLGVIMDPANGLAPWLVVVLVLLLTLVMWFALRPFRRLTLMVTPGGNHFGEAVGGLGSAARGARRAAGRLATTATGVFTGTAAAAAVTADDDQRPASTIAPQRAEADTSPASATPAGRRAEGPVVVAALAATRSGADPPRREADSEAPREEARGAPPGSRPRRVPAEAVTATATATAAGWSPARSASAELPAPLEPDDVDGEEVFVLYRPDRAAGEGVRTDA